MATNSRQKAKSFRGLNNVADPLRLDISWFAQADNVDVTNRNALNRARGYTRRTTNTAITGAYTTKDLQHLYVIDSGSLKSYNASLVSTTLTAGLSSAPMHFCEVNGQVFFSNGTDYGVIDKDVVWPWGVPAPAAAPTLAVGSGSLPAGTYSVVSTLTDARGIESCNSPVATIVVPNGSQVAITALPQVVGFSTNVYVTQADGPVYMLLLSGAGPTATYNCPPDSLGEELEFWELGGPRGTQCEYFAGQLFVSEYFAGEDQSVIWASVPLHFHHFDYGEGPFIVPGEVRTLDALKEGLIIGTDRAIHMCNGEALNTLANYGVVPGWHAAEFEGQLYLWSLRGLCRMLPFDNLTQNTVSVPPGISAGGVVLEKDGARRYVVALQKGGIAYNRR